MINTFYFHLSTFNFHIMLYERTLGQWLEHWAETTPDKEYIVYSDRNLRFTWSQFNRRVDDMAAQIEATTGRKPGKKEKRDLKEDAIATLPAVLALAQARGIILPAVDGSGYCQ